KCKVRRKHILEDSFSAFMKTDPEKLKLRLNVLFYGEDAVDYGGISREWFTLILPEITNPNYALFKGGGDVDKYIYHINSLSQVNQDHLQYFRFLGRVLAKALFENFQVDTHFSHLIYKTLLDLTFVLSDLEPIDADAYKSLVLIAENDPSGFMLDFTLTITEFDQMKEIKLKPNRKDIEVTQESNKEYIKLVIKHKLTQNFVRQLREIQKSFHDLLPYLCLKTFAPAEQEIIQFEIEQIEHNDWKENINFLGGYRSNSPQIFFFWDMILDMSNEQRAQLLQFATGTTLLPPGGFMNLMRSMEPRKFSIYISTKRSQQLPNVHICFKLIDLSPYETKEILFEKFKIAHKQ
ncbi:MAG: putative E3 ubiquitin-protein ligase Itchy, partial [Streblomastix strix]